MAHQRMNPYELDQYHPDEITCSGWEACEKRGDIAQPGWNIETDDNHEEEIE